MRSVQQSDAALFRAFERESPGSHDLDRTLMGLIEVAEEKDGPD